MRAMPDLEHLGGRNESVAWGYFEGSSVLGAGAGAAGDPCEPPPLWADSLTTMLPWASTRASGGLPEIVEDGVTGFRRDSEDDLVEMVSAVGSLDPAACRKRVVDLFSGEAMVQGYEAVFRQLLSG